MTSPFFNPKFAAYVLFPCVHATYTSQSHLLMYAEMPPDQGHN